MYTYLRRASTLLAVAVLMVPVITVFTPQMVAALESDPILINDCDDLQAIGADTESLAGDYRLNIDIDCAATATEDPNESEWVDGIVDGTLIADPYDGVINNGYNGFDPIGGPMDMFTGTFDGNGKVISNLWIFRKQTDFVGLFAKTFGASIHDLTLTNSSIVGRQYTGGLVGDAGNTIIERVTVNESMTRAYLSFYGGGIAGRTYIDTENDISLISESTVIGGTVHGSGNIIGGIVGSMNDTALSGSTTTADVDGGYSIGGAVGDMNGGTINSVSVGEVSVTSDYSENILDSGISKDGDKVGGLVGYINSGTITNSSSQATVEAEGNDVGGLVGSARQNSIEFPITITNSYSTGTVTGHGNVNDNATEDYGDENSFNVGGFAGSLVGVGVTVSDSYSTGNVIVDYLSTSAAAYSVGGFVGNGGCGSSISRSYATGDVSAAHATEVGGFVGYDDCVGEVGGTYEQVHAVGNVSGDVSVGGLFGSANQTTITKSYATGNASGSQYVGGLGGYIDGDAWSEGASTSRVTKSYATGNASATGNSAGGLFGYLSGGITDDVYARGSVTANNNVGGLVGEIAGSWQITHAYSTGSVEATIPDFVGGFIGNDTGSGTGEGSPINYSNYFDLLTAVTGIDAWATPKNTDEMKLAINQPTFEADPDPNEDINGFDFDTIWEYIVGQNNDYPLMIWQNDPVASPLCEEAQMTSTTGRIACDLVYEGGDESRAEQEFWMNPQYRKAGDTDWIGMEWVAQETGTQIFYDLEPSTAYEFRMGVANNLIDSEVVLEGTTRAADSDRDNDNVIDSSENNGPNRGDSNADGQLDAEQGGVTNFINPVTGKYVALSTADCLGGTGGTTNSASSVEAESGQDKDAGHSYPSGLMSFTVECATPCFSCVNEGLSVLCCPASGEEEITPTKITQYFYDDLDASKFIARKFNSVTKAYATIPGAVITNVTIGGQKAVKVVYEILDNGPLDEDPSLGTIKDPSGPALSAVGSPNTGINKAQK